jgi:uncharacterized protein
MNEKAPGSVGGEPPRESETSGGAAAKPRPCPICGKPAVLTTRPFCSKRCADVDLHRWLGGTYAIPVENDEAEKAPDEES